MLWKILIVIIEFFALVMQRIFTQKVLHRRDTRWDIEVLAWGGFFALSNYMTYFVSKTAWENTIVFSDTFLSDPAYFIYGFEKDDCSSNRIYGDRRCLI